MKIFIAGGSGTIGIPLVRALVAAKHEVIALTRTPAKRDELRSLGASVAVADALNREALMGAVDAARPTHVIHQLTAIPKAGVRRAGDLQATNRLRVDGTRNLLDAAIHARARRFIVGSFAMLSERGPASPESSDEAAAAVRSMERQVLEAAAHGSIEGIVLRYGMFYGLETPSTVSMIDMVRKRRLPMIRGDAGQLPLIHVDDAVSATVCALDAAPSGSAYDIVDDRAVSLSEIAKSLADSTRAATPHRMPAWLLRLLAPYMARLASLRMPLSNAKAKAELGWRPRYPTLRDGLAEMFPHAA
jgi:nucleoside-diphosphate-sugar epimerase